MTRLLLSFLLFASLLNLSCCYLSSVPSRSPRPRSFSSRPLAFDPGLLDLLPSLTASCADLAVATASTLPIDNADTVLEFHSSAAASTAISVSSGIPPVLSAAVASSTAALQASFVQIFLLMWSRTALNYQCE